MHAPPSAASSQLSILAPVFCSLFGALLLNSPSLQLRLPLLAHFFQPRRHAPARRANHILVHFVLVRCGHIQGTAGTHGRQGRGIALLALSSWRRASSISRAASSAAFISYALPPPPPLRVKSRDGWCGVNPLELCAVGQVLITRALYYGGHASLTCYTVHMDSIRQPYYFIDHCTAYYYSTLLLLLLLLL